MISHINRNELKKLNTSNGDYIIGTSILNSFIKLITLQKVTDAESSVSINYERTDKKYISEEISSRQNSA